MNILEAFKRFPTEENCITHLEKVRWNGEPTCPYCGSKISTPLPKERRHHCNTCNTSYSVTVGTVFHQTHLPLQKWFLALSLVLSAKKSISARQLAQRIEVHRNTAWRISMKIRDAMMQKQQRELLARVVEMDEAFIGPRKPREMHPDDKFINGRASTKHLVVGMVERNGYMVAKIAGKRDLSSRKLLRMIRNHIDTRSSLRFADQYLGYSKVSRFIQHQTANHSIWSVGEDGTDKNTIECLWALLMGGITRQFHHLAL